MLRLRVRVERADGKRAVKPTTIANSWLVSPDHEVLLPLSTAQRLALGDGGEAVMLKYRDAVNV